MQKRDQIKRELKYIVRDLHGVVIAACQYPEDAEAIKPENGSVHHESDEPGTYPVSEIPPGIRAD